MSQRDAKHLRCGSCGERAAHFIVLDGFDVPACLRHVNAWRPPDFPATVRDDLASLAEVALTDAERETWDRDPDEWPHTPPFHVFRALMDEDDNTWWRAGSGHGLNAYDAAVERVEELEATFAARVEQGHAEAWDEGANAAVEPVNTGTRMTLRAVIPFPQNPYREGGPR